MQHDLASTTDDRSETGTSTLAENRTQALLSRAGVRLSVCLCFLPAAILLATILWIVWTQTAQAPYWDEWDTVVLVEHARQGTLGIGELWAAHAGVHRMLLPRVLDLIVIQLTNWNRQIEMTFDLALSICASVLLYVGAARTVRWKPLVVVLAVPMSLVIYSLGQFGDWFAPFQITFVVAYFGVALCVWSATSPEFGWRPFGFVALGAIIATLSTFQGLMVWLAFLPSVAQKDKRKLIVWIGATIEIWVLYVIGFKSPGTQQLGWHRIFNYATVYLGAPVGYPDAVRSEIFGIVALLALPCNVMLYLCLGGQVKRILPWIEGALFAGLCGAATLVGRGGGGTVSALSSRYQIFSGIWWIALFVTGALVVEALVARPARDHASFPIQRWNPAIATARQHLEGMRPGIVAAQVLALAVVCVSLLVVNAVGFGDAVLWQSVQRNEQQNVVRYSSASDSCLKLYYPWPDVLRPRAAYLQREHLAIFGNPAVASRESADVSASRDGAACTKPYRFIDDVEVSPTSPGGYDSVQLGALRKHGQ